MFHQGQYGQKLYHGHQGYQEHENHEDQGVDNGV
jgi:hypothetical protein